MPIISQAFWCLLHEGSHTVTVDLYNGWRQVPFPYGVNALDIYLSYD